MEPNSSLIELLLKREEDRKRFQCQNTSLPQDLRGEQLFCNSSWDTVSCWPATRPDSLAVVSCPDSYDGVSFLTHQNASRYCQANGTWEFLSNYADCVPSYQSQDERELSSTAVMIIYYTGFSVSIIALVIALTIFSRFRTLRCVRNTIHCHLMLTFLLCAIVWIIMTTVTDPPWMCRVLVTVYNYLLMTNYFWMCVEGVYLTTVIVMTYSADNIKFWYFAVFGYGIPCPFLLTWLVIKLLTTSDTSAVSKCWLPTKENYYDYIYMGPILFVLFLNCLFFLTILWVLITKLKASNNLETRRYRKAARATLVLIPLLGITYVLFITPPSSHPQVQLTFTITVAVLQSTQGLWISIFYCFLNGEVRTCLRKRVSDWYDTRTMTMSRFTTSTASVPGKLNSRAVRPGGLASTPLNACTPASDWAGTPGSAGIPGNRAGILGSDVSEIPANGLQNGSQLDQPGYPPLLAENQV